MAATESFGADDYARRTYASPHWIVRFPHQRRFALAEAIVDELRPRTILDYGAGDGHFLIDLLRAPHRAEVRGLAVEPTPWMFDRLLQRAAEAGVADRVEAFAELAAPVAEPVDLIACMGVLEHLTLAERERFYAFVEAHLAPDGHVLIDVPVEHGLSLLIKNVGRRLLKGDAGEYTLRETARAAAGRRTVDPQRWDPGDPTDYIVSHKGFDHRLFGAELRARLRVEREIATPFARVPALAGGQEVFFLARRR